MHIWEHPFFGEAGLMVPILCLPMLGLEYRLYQWLYSPTASLREMGCWNRATRYRSPASSEPVWGSRPRSRGAPSQGLLCHSRCIACSQGATWL